MLFISNGLFAQMCKCSCDSSLVVMDAINYQLIMSDVMTGKPTDKDLYGYYLFKKAVLKKHEDEWRLCLKNRKIIKS